MASTVIERNGNGSNNLPVLFVILEEGGVAPTVGGEDVDDDDVPGKDIFPPISLKLHFNNKVWIIKQS